jgi:hypothetical protein
LLLKLASEFTFHSFALPEKYQGHFIRILPKRQISLLINISYLLFYSTLTIVFSKDFRFLIFCGLAAKPSRQGFGGFFFLINFSFL